MSASPASRAGWRRRAEELGVEIYPGFAGAEVLYNEDGSVRGVATGDMGVGKDGELKDSYTRGMELRAKYTLFAEGARGSLSKELIRKFKLDEGREPQKFGIGPQGALGDRPEEAQARARFSTRWAGRSTTRLAAARSSITSARIWCR